MWVVVFGRLQLTCENDCAASDVSTWIAAGAGMVAIGAALSLYVLRRARDRDTTDPLWLAAAPPARARDPRRLGLGAAAIVAGYAFVVGLVSPPRARTTRTARGRSSSRDPGPAPDAARRDRRDRGMAAVRAATDRGRPPLPRTGVHRLQRCDAAIRRPGHPAARARWSHGHGPPPAAGRHWRRGHRRARDRVLVRVSLARPRRPAGSRGPARTANSSTRRSRSRTRSRWGSMTSRPAATVAPSRPGRHAGPDPGDRRDRRRRTLVEDSRSRAGRRACDRDGHLMRIAITGTDLRCAT